MRYEEMRAGRRTSVPAAMVAGLAGLLAVGCDAGAQELDGTYRIISGDGPLTLVLRTADDGSVLGELAGFPGGTYRLAGELLVDEEGDVSVEGAMRGPGDGEFTFFEDDDGDFAFMITPYDAAGTPRLDQVLVYAASAMDPDEAAAFEVVAAAEDPGSMAGSDLAPGDPQAGTVPDPGSASRDARLFGTWATQVNMNTPGGTLVTEIRMRFDPDGTMVDLGSRSMASFDWAGIDVGGEGAGERAAWRTEGDVLALSTGASPWVPLARYTFREGRLVLIFGDGSVQFWSRVQG